MDYRKRKRKRGVTLTSIGLQKLAEARSQAEIQKNGGLRLTLEDLSDMVGVAPDTVMRVFAGEERVDKHTLRRCFQAFQLNLDSSDYLQPPTILDQANLDEPEDVYDSLAGNLVTSVPSIATSIILDLPKGQVPLESAFYVDRQPFESRCQEVIQEPGALIRIKAPKEMGKTSLMARILSQAREQDYMTVTLSLRLADESIFLSLERFLKWFCACMSQSLGLPNRLEEQWDEIFGNNYNAISYFEKCILASIDRPLVMALDDIDCIFKHQKIASDFLGLLRAMHEKAKYGDSNSEAWQRLRIIVIHSTEVYIALNSNQSPFNVGLSVELPGFTQSQVLDLAQRHQLNWDNSTVDYLMDYVGGHPSLIRQALYSIARNEISLIELVGISSFANHIYGGCLGRLWGYLQQQPALLSAFSEVIKASEPVLIDSTQGFLLKSLGLIHFQDGMGTPSCQLCIEYFRDRV
jgi:transcriptional regulator with XRE-family HTH domain